MDQGLSAQRFKLAPSFISSGELKVQPIPERVRGQKIRAQLQPPPKELKLSNLPECFDQQQYLNAVAQHGGRDFVARAQRYAKTDQGDPILFRPWFKEYLEALGDWRLHQIYTTGAAQVGKTLGHLLALCDLLIHGRINTGWCYATKTALAKYQPDQFRPVLGAWQQSIEEQFGCSLGLASDAKTLELYQIGGISGHFAFANTSVETTSKVGKAIIAGSGASFSAGVMIYEERSRHRDGVDLSARLGASPIESRPQRDLGTPGGGMGIEKLIVGVDHYFYPHYNCTNPHCSAHSSGAPLDPMGCLLVETEYTDSYGRKRSAFFSDAGRPMDWWRSDETNPVSSAMFCCSRCGEPLTLRQRTEDAYFRCTITGITLRDFLNSIAPGFAQRDRIAIHLSPLCRESSRHLAADLIRKGLAADNPRVWQQEDLGIPSSASTARLDLEGLRPLINAPRISAVGTEKPWRTYAGLDFGRDGVWLWINQVFVPANWRSLSHGELKCSAIREVAFAGKLHKDQVLPICERFGVSFGLVDNEPETIWSAQLCQDAPFAMADQVGGPDDYRMGTVRTGGEEFPCWKINNQFFHRVVFDQVTVPQAFDGRPSYRFPADWAKWAEASTEESPLRHLQGPHFDISTEKWVRGSDKVDDLFYAALFAEAAFAIDLEQGNAAFTEPDWT